jgi:hypothetical protein
MLDRGSSKLSYFNIENMDTRRHMLIFLFVSMQMGRDRSEAIKLGRAMPQ